MRRSTRNNRRKLAEKGVSKQMRGVLKETHFASSGHKHHTYRFKPSWFERSATPRGTLDANASVVMSLSFIRGAPIALPSRLQGESILLRGCIKTATFYLLLWLPPNLDLQSFTVISIACLDSKGSAGLALPLPSNLNRLNGLNYLNGSVITRDNSWAVVK
jgi:hypothetical protein